MQPCRSRRNPGHTPRQQQEHGTFCIPAPITRLTDTHHHTPATAGPRTPPHLAHNTPINPIRLDLSASCCFPTQKGQRLAARATGQRNQTLSASGRSGRRKENEEIIPPPPPPSLREPAVLFSRSINLSVPAVDVEVTMIQCLTDAAASPCHRCLWDRRGVTYGDRGPAWLAMNHLCLAQRG